MKRYLITIAFTLLCMVGATAQSMTDEQVIRFVLKEQKAGSTQQEIAVKLVQRGVTTEQIKRVQRKAERLKKNQGLGTVNKQTVGCAGTTAMSARFITVPPRK